MGRDINIQLRRLGHCQLIDGTPGLSTCLSFPTAHTHVLLPMYSLIASLAFATLEAIIWILQIGVMLDQCQDLAY